MDSLLQYYGQYLIVCQQNYTLTHLANHSIGLSHDRMTRYLSMSTAGPSDIWTHISKEVEWSDNGYLLFDDTVLDKSYSRKIEGVRRQYSGNVHGLVRGIGVVQCVYYNAEKDRFWVIDYRIFDPEHDGKDKLDHVWDMLLSCEEREVRYQNVLMDSWYATAQLFKRLSDDGKTFYCPIKSNRQVYEATPPTASAAENAMDILSGAAARASHKAAKIPYQAVKTLSWSEADACCGKTIRIKDLPQHMTLQLHRVGASTSSTDATTDTTTDTTADATTDATADATADATTPKYTYLVTNASAPITTAVAQQHSRYRWKIEQVHREEKQLTGIERCQCRRRNCQRTHIAAAIMVWNSLKNQVQTLNKTIYQLKQDLLANYLRNQLANPDILFA